MKTNSKTTMRILQVLAALCLVLLLSTPAYSLDPNPAPTIVILDGEAILAEVDEEGAVIKKYIAYPDYFVSNKSHEEKVEEARAHYAFLKKHQIDQIRFIAFGTEILDLDEVAVANLKDISRHYMESYANEVKITAATREDNAKAINEALNMIKFTLQTFGVPDQDIVIVYKQDVGEEPTQFIKVQSNMR